MSCLTSPSFFYVNQATTADHKSMKVKRMAMRLGYHESCCPFYYRVMDGLAITGTGLTVCGSVVAC